MGRVGNVGCVGGGECWGVRFVWWAMTTLFADLS